MAAKIEKFPGEEALEDLVYVAVYGHTAWPNNALTHHGIDTQWRNNNFGWFLFKKINKDFF